MNGLQYGSLSPTRRFDTYPSEPPELLEGGADRVVKEFDAFQFFPIYDNAENDENLVYDTLLGAQTLIEGLIDYDCTRKKLQAYWQNPDFYIRLTGNNQVIEKVEQYQNDSWVEITNYKTFGKTKVVVQLDYLYQTRITYVSGFDENKCPTDIKNAIIQQASYMYKNRNDPNQAQAEVKGGLCIPARTSLTNYLK